MTMRDDLLAAGVSPVSGSASKYLPEFSPSTSNVHRWRIHALMVDCPVCGAGADWTCNMNPAYTGRADLENGIHTARMLFALRCNEDAEGLLLREIDHMLEEGYTLPVHMVSPKDEEGDCLALEARCPVCDAEEGEPCELLSYEGLPMPEESGGIPFVHRIYHRERVEMVLWE